MESSSDREQLAASVSKLALDTTKIKASVDLQAKTKKKKTQPIVDSWEDEEISDSGPEEEEEEEVISGGGNMMPDPPPPTPISPTVSLSPAGVTNLPNRMTTLFSYDPNPPSAAVADFCSDSSGSIRGGLPSKRPEKTDAVARRMIAGALGLRVPRKTEEQKAYEESLKKQEKARKEKQKEEERKMEEDAARAKAAIWGD